MRTLILIFIFCIYTSISWSQRIYKSSHTIHIPSEIREDIPRTIAINQGYILIKSYKGNENVHNQLMVIKKECEDLNYDGNFKIYHCVSPDEKFPSVVTIRQENPSVITVTEPSDTPGIEKVYNLVLEFDQ